MTIHLICNDNNTIIQIMWICSVGCSDPLRSFCGYASGDVGGALRSYPPTASNPRPLSWVSLRRNGAMRSKTPPPLVSDTRPLSWLSLRRNGAVRPNPPPTASDTRPLSWVTPTGEMGRCALTHRTYGVGLLPVAAYGTASKICTHPSVASG